MTDLWGGVFAVAACGADWPPIGTGELVFLTTVTTEGRSKAPQTGTEYSNEYVAELVKQGLTQAQLLEKVTERDAVGESGVEEGVLYGADAGRAAPEEQFFAGDSSDRWDECVCVCGESGDLCV